MKARCFLFYADRYPRGESYQDIVSRLEPVLVELMRQKDPVLIVSHQATLRVVVSYLRDMGESWTALFSALPIFQTNFATYCIAEPRLCPDVLIPLHTVMQVRLVVGVRSCSVSASYSHSLGSQMVPKAYGSEELHYTNAQAPPQPPVVTGVDAQAAAHGRH